jgi:hypothetical protein
MVAMKNKKCKFYNLDGESIKIPAFVARIDKSVALRRFQRLAATTPPEWSFRSPYFEQLPDQNNSKPIKSSLLEHEAMEYGYRIR